MPSLPVHDKFEHANPTPRGLESPYDFSTQSSPPPQYETTPSEKGRWVDDVMAAITVCLGSVRIAEACSQGQTLDAVNALQGAAFILIGVFIAAPELKKWTCCSWEFAARSPMFDRGVLFVVTGTANASVGWPVVKRLEVGQVTKVPSYVFATILIVTGVVYIVLSAKYYNRFHSATAQETYINQQPMPKQMPRFNFVDEPNFGPPTPARFKSFSQRRQPPTSVPSMPAPSVLPRSFEHQNYSATMSDLSSVRKH